MIMREKSLSNNSIGPDFLQDDITAMNYMALAYAIAGIKTQSGIRHIGISTVCKAFRLYDANVSVTDKLDTRKKGTYTRTTSPITVRNILTGESKEYESSYKAAKDLGIKTTSIAMYIRKGHILNKTYYISTKENASKFAATIHERARKRVRAYNIKTKESKEFDSLVDASKFIGVSSSYVTTMAQDCRTTRVGWKVEYID